MFEKNIERFSRRKKLSSAGDISDSDDEVRRASEVGYELRSKWNTFLDRSASAESETETPNV